MRSFIHLGIAAGLAAMLLESPWIQAGECAGNYAPASCQMREPTCEAPPRAPEQPQQPVQAAPPGMFVQPPANGTVYGPVERRDVEGAALTFPALTLRFPSLRLPSMARSRSNARMEIDSASAPYVQGYPTAAVPVALAPQMPFAPQAPNQPQQGLQPPAAPPDMPNAPQLPACDAPQGPYRAPSCDAFNKQAALEEKLRTIEAAERRLAARIDELQQLAAQLDGATAPAFQVPLSSGVGPMQRPIGPPEESPLRPVSFGAQRTSYLEPVRLSPDQQVIREPSASPGRITGIRNR